MEAGLRTLATSGNTEPDRIAQLSSKNNTQTTTTKPAEKHTTKSRPAHLAREVQPQGALSQAA